MARSPQSSFPSVPTPFLALLASIVVGCSGGEAASVEDIDGGPSNGGIVGSSSATRPGDAGAASTRDGGQAPTVADAGPSAPGSPPAKPPPRADLNALAPAEQQKVFDAITGFIKTATIPVKVAASTVVPWSSPGTLTPVSVVRAHHAIHHDGETFFTCHRWYLETMEKAIAPSLPGGRMPAWKPNKAMPAPFTLLAAPTGGDCETKGSLIRKDSSGALCEFAWTSSYTNVDGDSVTIEGLENTGRTVAFPSKYQPGNVCSFPSAAALAKDIGAGLVKSGGYHNLVHNTIGGTMQSMDAPAAAIFWPWHATIDEIFQSWLDCNVGKKPPVCP